MEEDMGELEPAWIDMLKPAWIVAGWCWQHHSRKGSAFAKRFLCRVLLVLLVLLCCWCWLHAG